MAKSPVAAEALNEAVSFSFKGETYTIPAANEWPYEALVAFEEGKIASLIGQLLGEEQHATFRATKPRLGDVNEFVVELQKAAGISGN